MNSDHIHDLFERAPALVPLQTTIAAAFDVMRDSLAAGGKILLCGNGGSAADADH